jgi:hypothetical protein
MSYARAWRGVLGLLTATGVGLSMLELSPAMTLVAVVLMSACTTTVVLVVQVPRDGTTPSAGRGLDHHLIQGIWLGSGVVAAATLVAASPPVALLLALLATATSPSVLRRCAAGSVLRQTRPREATSPRSPGSGTQVGSPPERPAPGTPRCDEVAQLLAGLSDGELCGLWRSTFWELKKQHSADECLTLVTLRQSCLDELDRRDPSGLQAWLASGARASGGPERYLNPPHDPGSAHAA